MYKMIALCVFLVALVHSSCGSLCSKPTVTDATSFTTEDGTVLTNVAFISEFTLQCAGGVSELPLYAEVNGRTFPALHISSNRYQVSWVEEVQKARSGEYLVNFYDEEGYSNLRKALRNEQQANSVTPLFTVSLKHPGTYQGPWLNSEFLAAAVAVLVWYFAYSTKCKLLV